MKNDVFYVIDLDRTLVDVEKVMEVTKQVCNEMQINFKKIYKDQQDLSKKGTAYSPFGYISNNSDIEQFKKRFIELSKDGKILFYDSRKFIEELRSKKNDFVILTHGIDDRWQMLKIRAAGFSRIPYLIVKSRNKGRFIKNWTDAQGKFKPDIKSLSSYNKCVFVDDRVEAFLDLPKNCQGYLLDREYQPDTSTNLPKNLQIINSLSEIKL